jgi:hypothetical protein
MPMSAMDAFESWSHLEGTEYGLHGLGWGGLDHRRLGVEFVLVDCRIPSISDWVMLLSGTVSE